MLYLRVKQSHIYKEATIEFDGNYEFEVQCNCLGVLKYLPTKRSRKFRVFAFFIEDIIETNIKEILKSK